MAHSKHRGHKRSSVGKYVRLGGKILGGLVIGGPAINVVMADAQSGNFMSVGNDVLFAYTGLGGTTPINFEQTLKGVGSIVGGIAIIKLFSWVAKRF